METRTKLVCGENRLGLIFGLVGLFIFMATWLQNGQKFKAQAFSPILPVSEAPGDFRPVVFSLRDPTILKRKPEDSSEAERLALEIKEIRTGIERLTGPRALEQHEQAYVGLAALSYFFQDQMRSSSDESDVAKARQSFNNVAQLLEFHAAQVTHTAGPGKIKARAQYFYFATRYARFDLAQQETKEIVQNFKALAEGRDLSKDLKRRAQFIVAIHQLSSSDTKLRSKSVGQVVSLSRGMDPVVAVGAYLQLAKNARRISGGQKDAYKKYLMQASLKSSSLRQAEKVLVLRQLISIWRSNDPNALSFRMAKMSPQGNKTGKVPFNLNSFKDSFDVLVLLERSALAEWHQNQQIKAIAKYERLASQLGDHPQGLSYKAAMDIRTIDLRRSHFFNSKSKSRDILKNYEVALINKEKTYLDLGVLGPQRQSEAQATRSKIVDYRRELAHRELDRASTESTHSDAIRIAEAFLNDHQNDADKVTLREKVAKSYVSTKNYDPAVSIYRELAGSSQGSTKKRYLTMAIGAQSLRADWPVKVPWEQSVAPTEETLQYRELLKSLYIELQNLTPQDWFVAAHIGHLDLHVGQAEKAFHDWQIMITKFPRDYHASQAAGWMMNSYEKSRNWAKLEDLSRVCLKSKVTGQYQKARVNPHAKLALALLESGKEFLAQKNYAVSVKKLHEFTYLRPTPARHDEGFYTLSLAYWGNRQFRDSVQSVLNFVESYPNSQYTRPALLNGGDWSTALTYEENALSLHAQFLKQYPNDPQAPRVRQSLYELTIGRELYSEALELLSEEQKGYQKAEDPVLFAQTEAKIMALEANHGSMDRALVRARNLINSPGSTDELKANAIRMMIRNAAKSGQTSLIKQNINSLDSLGDTQEKREAKAEGLLLIANIESKNAIKDYYNLELKDPYAILQERYRAFSRQKNNYLNVCTVGTTSSCAPALHQLARLAEKFGASLEDISVQTTLAKSDVERFQKSKQFILTSISRTTIEADQGSVQHTFATNKGSDPSGDGYGMDPEWVEGVSWQNEANWTSARPQGLGGGFLQWPEKKSGVAP